MNQIKQYLLEKEITIYQASQITGWSWPRLNHLVKKPFVNPYKFIEFLLLMGETEYTVKKNPGDSRLKEVIYFKLERNGSK